MLTASIGKKRAWGVFALLAIALLGCMLAAAPAAYAVEKAPLSLQGGAVSAKTSGVTKIILYRCSLDKNGDCQYQDIGSVYLDGVAKSMAGVSYNPATKTITLNNCNDPSMGLSVEGRGCDVNVKVKGPCKMSAFKFYDVGVNVIGEGTLILNSKKYENRSVFLSFMEKPAVRGLHVASSVTMRLHGKDDGAGTVGCVDVDGTLLTAKKAIRLDGIVSARNVKTKVNPAYSATVWSEVLVSDSYGEEFTEDVLRKLSKDGTVYYGNFESYYEVWEIYKVVGEQDGIPKIDYLENVSGTDAAPDGYVVVKEKVPATYDYTIMNTLLTQKRRGVATGSTAVVGGVTYKVTNDAAATVSLKKGKKSAKNATVPARVKIKGKSYTVTGIVAKAFKGTKAETLVVKSKKLTKKSVKGSLKGSKVKTVKVKVGAKKVNKKYVRKYKKIFTKKNCGKKVKVK